MSDGGRLWARPGAGDGTGRAGLFALEGEDAAARDSFLYVPERALEDGPAALVLMLHGAGGQARHGLDALQAHADRTGLILLAPASAGVTWDVIRSGFGPDVVMVDGVLGTAFAHYAVDPARVAIAGFSDGASYALSLGLTNGDLFSHVLAFSPGFVRPGELRGRPPVYVSHGSDDRVLPVDRCSRRIVPALRQAGYEVRYDEFTGGHVVPPELAEEAVDWVMGAETG